MADLNVMLGKLKSERRQSAWFIPVDAMGEPFGDPGSPFRIHLLSRRSEEWRALERTWQVDRAVSAANNGKVTAEDAARFEQHLIKCHIAITQEWENLTHEGQPVPCTPTTMTNLYNDIDFREQLFAFTADPRNYGQKGEIEPQTEVEDVEKKSESGVNSDSLSATT